MNFFSNIFAKFSGFLNGKKKGWLITFWLIIIIVIILLIMLLQFKNIGFIYEKF